MQVNGLVLCPPVLLLSSVLVFPGYRTDILLLPGRIYTVFIVSSNTVAIGTFLPYERDCFGIWIIKEVLKKRNNNCK